jgi:arylsulfatase A-like enzyme
MNHRRSQGVLFVALLSLALAVFPVPVRAQKTNLVYPYATNRANIILIVADCLGYGDLGCYGQTRIKTPSIDALAASGMRFTAYYAGSSQSAPSHAALLLGKDTGHINIRGDGDSALSRDEITMAQLLQSVDYMNGAFGEWGLGDDYSGSPPLRKGFTEWFGILDMKDAQNYYLPSLNRNSPETGEGNLEVTENLDGKMGTNVDDSFTEAAWNFLRIEKPVWFLHYRPFFLYLPYTIPRPNLDLAARTGNGLTTSPTDAAGEALYGREQWPQPEKDRAKLVSRLDRYVGVLMARLKELKIEQNTVVIFTSATGPDNRGGVDTNFFKSAGPFRGARPELYEGGIRVPFIVSWPAHIKPGTTSDLPCALWDVMPTALQIAGRFVPNDLDGISLLATLTGQAQTNRHENFYWETHDGGIKQAARMGDWKALRSAADAPMELYDLKTDPGEQTNVADKNPEVIARMETFLKTARTATK